MLLVIFGVGVCIGLLVVGVLMWLFGVNMLYVFVSVCVLILVWWVYLEKVSGQYWVDDVLLYYVLILDNMISFLLVVVFDLWVDEQVVQEQMVDGEFDMLQVDGVMQN